MCDTFIDEIVGRIPKVRFVNEEGASLLSRLILRAERKLWIREKNLTAWGSTLVINSLRKFLESSYFEELRLTFYKADKKDDALLKLREDRSALWGLLAEHKEKIQSGNIKLYWWEEGCLYKQHLIISERDVCTESHYSDPECTCGPAYFFFDSPGDVSYWQQVYDRAVSRESEDDMFSEYSKEELLKAFHNNA